MAVAAPDVFSACAAVAAVAAPAFPDVADDAVHRPDVLRPDFLRPGVLLDCFPVFPYFPLFLKAKINNNLL